MDKNEIDYYSKSLECIEEYRKGYYGYDFDSVEYNKWYHCIKILGKYAYNYLCDKSSDFDEFCAFLYNEDLSLDIFRAPLIESKIASIRSNDPHSYTERTTYQRNIETDESHNIRKLIWCVAFFSKFPQKVWDKIK